MLAQDKLGITHVSHMSVPADLAACTWMLQDAHEAVVSEMRAAYEERIAALSSDSDAKLQGRRVLFRAKREGTARGAL